LNADAIPVRLLGPLYRFTAAATGLTGPAGVRERLGRAGAGELPDGEVDALGIELDVLADLLARVR
jgi:hypothetical protein